MAPRLTFSSTPCTWCVRAAKWVPVIFIVSVIVWSYYAYVIQLNFCFYLLFYHISFIMFVWAYWQTIFTNIGTVPKQFRLPPADLDNYESAVNDDTRRFILQNFVLRNNLPVFNRTISGDIRYCEKCCHVKPDRSHHCSVCGDCVLKMDHHCPWVNNCVSFTNYKFFILFLGYSLLYCIFIASTTLSYFITFWKGDLNGPGKFHILFVFFVSVMFGISLVSLFGYHCFLISRNRSTLESFRAPIFKYNDTWLQDKEGFSLGAYNNFLEIFGDDKNGWFLPVFTSIGDGVSFPMRCHLTSASSPPVQSSGNRSSSLGDGVTFPQQCIEEDRDGLLNTRQGWLEEEEHSAALFSHSENSDLKEVIIQANHTNPV